MSQNDLGNIESPISGSSLINGKLEPWRDTLHSMHSGPTRPTYAVAGLQWLDTTTTPWIVKVYDGADDIAIGTINPTSNVFAPSIPNNLITLAKLATQAANTVLANATNASAVPSAVALAASQLLGRGLTGDIAPITLGTGLSMVGTALSASNTIPWGLITGFIPLSFAGTNTTASLSVSAGQATDSTNATVISKATSTSWAVSNGAAVNGYQGGTALPASADIHFYAITGTSGTGTFASTSVTPTLPSGYTYYRRIFSIRTDGAGAPISIIANEIGGGALQAYLVTPTLDVAVSTVPTAGAGYQVNVPGGIKVELIARFWQPAAAVNSIILSSPDESNVAPVAAGVSGANAYDTAGNGAAATLTSSTRLITDTSRNIRARASVATGTLSVVTRGWIDFRR